MKLQPLRLALLALAAVTVKLPAQTLTAYPESDNSVTPVYNFINSATKTLDMTMYEFVDSTAQAELIALARKGVAVRVILDQNLEKSSNTAAYDALTAGGVFCHWANPAYAATHQKTITVDNATSMILTLNLTSRYYSTTRDFALTNTDPKDVAEIESVFNADFTDATVMPTAADDLIWSPNLSETSLVDFINSAQHTLLVENEEMGNAEIVTALANRAKAGVSVIVIMTNDANTYATEFTTLTAAGVLIYTYPYDATALYIHAKIMSLDYGYPNQSAYLGSINYSTASMTKNRELGQTTQDNAILLTLNTALSADAKGGTAWPTAKAKSHTSHHKQQSPSRS